MKKFWRREKPQPKPVVKRYCDKGHDISEARMAYFAFGDVVTKWLCPYCLVEFIDSNVSGFMGKETR